MNAAPEQPLLQVRGLRVSYAVRHRGHRVRLRALDGLSFDLASGHALGVVGESGSGKSTLARALLRLTAADAGEIRFRGDDLLALRGAALQRARAHVQMIFQDGISALDPRQRIGDALSEPLQVFRPRWSVSQRHASVLAMLERVGLEARLLQRFPHEVSGGQAQRIGIARALILGPELVVCDEPLSSLDVSIKAQITQLLQRLQRELRLSLLFIAHDLPAVQLLCDRVLVLYLGRVMEIAARDAVFRAPQHPYTRALLQAIPIADPRRARARPAPIIGDLPSSLAPPSGCVFRTRCPHAIERCTREVPALRRVGDSEVACHRAGDI
ncbi:MAG TPA: oligopeptide/dipeptide ABC transporter ATP-binding protein [Steroidobacteraceae bacterium]|jgi:oligopeptide transport system ATP-binding protein